MVVVVMVVVDQSGPGWISACSDAAFGFAGGPCWRGVAAPFSTGTDLRGRVHRPHPDAGIRRPCATGLEGFRCCVSCLKGAVGWARMCARTGVQASMHACTHACILLLLCPHAQASGWCATQNEMARHACVRVGWCGLHACAHASARLRPLLPSSPAASHQHLPRER